MRAGRLTDWGGGKAGSGGRSWTGRSERCFLDLKPKADARELNFVALDDFVGFSDKGVLVVLDEEENHQPRGEGLASTEVIAQGRTGRGNLGTERWIYA